MPSCQDYGLLCLMRPDRTFYSCATLHSDSLVSWMANVKDEKKCPVSLLQRDAYQDNLAKGYTESKDWFYHHIWSLKLVLTKAG